MAAPIAIADPNRGLGVGVEVRVRVRGVRLGLGDRIGEMGLGEMGQNHLGKCGRSKLVVNQVLLQGDGVRHGDNSTPDLVERLMLDLTFVNDKVASTKFSGERIFYTRHRLDDALPAAASKTTSHLHYH